ncbi:MAG: hypothetical protein H0T46_00975 [Deltaproteobacteria bacterium]|nr:hypothetical protein [Deltaproteobacteria bacterium]
MTRYGWLIAIAAAYLYVFPYFPKIQSANELPRVYLTRALVEDGTVQIDKGVRQWGGTADVSPNGGHHYSNKAPGSSMLAVPAYAIASVVTEPGLGLSMWLCRVAAGIVPMLVFLWLLWGFLARFAPDPAVRTLVLVAYGLGSMAMTYSILFFSHQLGAVCVGSSWILALDVVERRRGLKAMAASGALAGAALLTDYQAVFAAVPVAVMIVVKIRRWPATEILNTLGSAILGAAIPIAILLVYHTVAFGSPLRTGYDASTSFAVYHQQGFLGITELRSEAFWGSLIRPDNGLFILAPWLLLAFPGAVTLVKNGERGIAITAGAVVVIYVLFISSINFWRGGWGIGPRYITAMLPFMLPLIASQLQAWKEKPLVLGVAASTIVVGVAVYSLSACTFPYWPDSLKNPLVEVTFRMLGDNLVAPSLGSAIGIGGIAGVLPFLACVYGVLGVALYRAATLRGMLVAFTLGSALLVAFTQLPRTGPHAEKVYDYVRTAVSDL